MNKKDIEQLTFDVQKQLEDSASGRDLDKPQRLAYYTMIEAISMYRRRIREGKE